MKNSPKYMIKSDYFVVIFSSMFHAAVLFLYGIYTRNQIPPAQFGLFSIASVVLNYLNYVQFGVLNSFNRDYPQAIGSGDDQRATTLRNTTFWYLFIVYAFIGLIISAVVLFTLPSQYINSDLAWGIVLVCIVALLSNIALFSTSILKSEGKFRFSAKIVIMSTLVQAVLGSLLVTIIGYYGLYIALIGFSVSGLVINSGTIKRIKYAFDMNLLKSLIVYGLPLLANSFVWTITMSTDQFVILAFSTTEALGIYSVAQMTFSVMMLIPQSISQVLYVKLSNNYGRTNSIDELLVKTKKYTELISWFSSALVVAVVFALPFLVKYFMPQYADGIFPAQIICVGVAFYGTTMLYGNIFSVLKENRRLLFSTILLCASNIILSVSIVIVFGFRLSYVAIGTSVSYVIYSLILITILTRRYSVGLFDIIKKTWGPVFITLLPNVVIYSLILNPTLKLIWAFIFLGVEVALFQKIGRRYVV